MSAEGKRKSNRPEDMLRRVIRVAEILAKSESKGVRVVSKRDAEVTDPPKTRTGHFDIS